MLNKRLIFIISFFVYLFQLLLLFHFDLLNNFMQQLIIYNNK